MRMIRGVHGQIDEELISAIEEPNNTVIRWFVTNTESTQIFDTSSPSSNPAPSEYSELHEHLEAIWPKLERLVQAREQRLSQMQVAT